MSPTNSPGTSRADRRQFIKGSLSLVALGALSRASEVRADDAKAATGAEPLKAAVMGHTGRGDYGHGLDVAFNGVPGVHVVAVADPDEQGRAGAAQRAGAARQYADYREMLEKEKPNLVSIAPRWTDQHHAMGMAALAAGAHLFTEKPFATTLAEADELLATAEKSKLKIAVAHQMRLAPSIVHLKQVVSDGSLIGDLLHVHAWGKQDGRAGGEDMLVLGTHLFNLINFLAGDPLWCTARVLHGGRDITPADARAVGEAIGPVAGDEIYAQFAFDNGVNASFNSRGRARETTGHWGLELVGSKGVARVLANVYPVVLVKQSGGWSPAGKTDEWKQPENDPGRTASAEDQAFGNANRRVVDDWLDAIKTDREPAASGRAAAKAVEMVMAVYHAGLTGSRVKMPLEDREHPLRAR